jgi:hypothetical protein
MLELDLLEIEVFFFHESKRKVQAFDHLAAGSKAKFTNSKTLSTADAANRKTNFLDKDFISNKELSPSDPMKDKTLLTSQI